MWYVIGPWPPWSALVCTYVQLVQGLNNRRRAKFLGKGFSTGNNKLRPQNEL